MIHTTLARVSRRIPPLILKLRTNKQSNRLIFQNSRSDKGSGERPNYNINRKPKVHNKKLGKNSKGYKNTPQNFTPKYQIPEKLNEVLGTNPKRGNALANNRKVLTSASNNFFKNSLLVVNSNRGGGNAYLDQNYDGKVRKDARSLENNDKGDKPKLNYFGHREKHASLRMSRRESSHNFSKDSSMSNIKKRENGEKYKNYYTPNNMNTKLAKTNNFMAQDNSGIFKPVLQKKDKRSLASRERSRERSQEKDDIPDMSSKNSNKSRRKPSSVNRDDDKNLAKKLALKLEIPKREKPSIDSSKGRNVSLEKKESSEAREHTKNETKKDSTPTNNDQK